MSRSIKVTIGTKNIKRELDARYHRGVALPPDEAFARLQRDIMACMAGLFGGVSVSNVSGAWVNADGKLIIEPSLVFESVSVQEPTHFAMTTLNRHCARWAKEWGEDCVLLTITNIAHAEFIEAGE